MPMGELTPEELLQFGECVKSLNGMNFDGYTWLGLRISLRERMKDCRLLEAPAYLAHLKSDIQEQDELIALLSVPETYFFRDRVQFDVLRDKILPEMVERKSKLISGKPVIKIVSAGCSTGEEVYSLAIAVLQSGLMEQCEFDINGFDISKNALAKARSAEYTKHSFREKDTEFLINYFVTKGSGFVLRNEVKNMVKFHQAELFHLANSHFSFNNTDIIFFRNVSIYFDQEGVLKALKIMEENLVEDGYLFLGPSESLFGRKTGFEMQRINSAFVCRHKGKGAARQEEWLSFEAVPLSTKEIRLPTVKPNVPQLAVPIAILPPEVQNNEIHYQNALGYAVIKLYDKAEQEFQEQLKITPRHAKSLVGLAQIYADTGRDEIAIDTCNKAIESDNLLTDSYFILGLIHYKRGEYSEAVSDFKKTIYCDENHFLAQYYLGAVYQELHKAKSAQQQFQTTINVIQALGEEGLRREIAGLSGSYVMSLCMDSVLNEEI